MDMTLEKTLLYALKAGALLSIFVVLLRSAFEEYGSFTGAIIFFISGSLGMLYVVFNGLILTNSKGLNNFGAFVAMIIGLTIIGVSLLIVLKGDSLGDFWHGGWNITQFLVQILLAGLAGVYLIFESGKREMFIERLGLVGIIPIFILVQSINPYKGDSVPISWSADGFISVAVVTIIALIVLFFSQLQHSIAVPLILALVAFVTNFASVKSYLFDDTKAADDYDFFSTEFSAVVLLQLVVSGVFLAYCAYIVWRTRNSEQVITS